MRSVWGSTIWEMSTAVGMKLHCPVKAERTLSKLGVSGEASVSGVDRPAYGQAEHAGGCSDNQTDKTNVNEMEEMDLRKC